MIRPLRWYTSLLFTGAIFIAAAAASAAQTPSPAPAAAAQPSAPAAPRPPQKPKNLKVLPEDTDLRAVMHQYEADLGVHCSFCHAAADATTHRTDFSSDTNPKEDKARYMIQMTADLNTKYLAQMPGHDAGDGDPITCGTCHRGQSHPSVFVGQPPAEANRPPAASGAVPPAATPGAEPATGSSR